MGYLWTLVVIMLPFVLAMGTNEQSTYVANDTEHCTYQEGLQNHGYVSVCKYEKDSAQGNTCCGASVVVCCACKTFQCGWFNFAIGLLLLLGLVLACVIVGGVYTVYTRFSLRRRELQEKPLLKTVDAVI